MRQKVFVCWQTCIETLSCDDHVFGTDEDRRRKTCRIYTRARNVLDKIPSQFPRQLFRILLASAFFFASPQRSLLLYFTFIADFILTLRGTMYRGIFPMPRSFIPVTVSNVTPYKHIVLPVFPVGFEQTARVIDPTIGSS